MALALGAAAYGQSVVRAAPWPAIAAFAVAAVLMGIAAWRRPADPEPGPAAPPALTRGFLVLLAAGIVLCGGAGVLVYQARPATLTHGVWAVGLMVLGCAAALGPRARPARSLDRRTVLIGVALAAAALLVFGWSLTTLPTEVHGDDAEVGLDAVRLMSDFNLFGAGWFELPRFHALPTLLGLRVFGINLLGLRATSAALGIAAVLLLFAVARRLWTLEVAVLAALLLIGQRFFIHLSRAGYHYVDTPVLSLLALWLFLRLWQDGRRGAGIWCGIALGLGIQTYYASRLVPVLLALTWLPWMIGTPRGERWRRVAHFAVIGAVALAAAAPMFGYFAHDWAAFWERTRDTSMFNPAVQRHLAYGYGTDNPLQIALIQLRAAVGVFNAVWDNSVQYGLRGALLDPISAALFIAGLGWVAAGLRERRHQLVLLWLALPLLAGGALTIDTPFYPRLSGLVPFAVLVVALALHAVLQAVRRAIPAAAGRHLAAALAGGAVALIAARNLQSYFVDYATVYRHSPCVEIAAWVRAHGAGKTTYMVGSAPGFYIRHGAIRFLTHGYETRDVDDFAAFVRGRALDPAESLFIAMPHGVGVLPELEAAVGPLTLQTHRNRNGDAAFLTAVPEQSGVAPDPPDRFDQPSVPPPGVIRLGEVLSLVDGAARALLAASGAAVLLLMLLGWRRGERPPGVAALREPLTERLGRWQRRLFGPDARERLEIVPARVLIGLLVLVVGVGLVIRTYQLTELPAGFFCDEAGNGVNAYSLLRTGRDETGARWPLYVWSFGVSYKNPVFLYSAMLPMAVLGPTELAVRLTAALYGAGTVVAMFYLGRALMGPLVGVLAALLLAICPWHVHFSRIGYELITLPFFFTLAMTSLVRWTQGRRTLAQAMVLFGLCLYTYVPAKLIVPLFLAAFALLFWRPLRQRWRETGVAALLLLLTAAPVILFDAAHQRQAGSYFRNTTLLARSEGPAEIARTFAANYAAFFSPVFLFERSTDRIIRHGLDEHGQLYPFFAPLLILGLAAAVLRRDRALWLPVLWLAFYPVAPALMNEIPSASRGIAGAPAFCLIAAIGAGMLFRWAGRLGQRRAIAWAAQGTLAAVGLAVVLPAVWRYWTVYRDEYPRYSAKHYTGFQYGHREVVEYFRRHYDEYPLLLLTTRLSNQPEVFLRFYDGLREPPDPARVPPFAQRQRMVVGNPEMYQHYQPSPGRMLFAVLPEEVPLFADAEVQERVIAPDGSAAFVLVTASALKEFVSTWMVTGLLPAGDRSPPPRWTPDDPPRGTARARWRLYDRPQAGVGLNDFFVPNAEHACAWAVNFVTTDEARDVRVFAGFDDTGEVWINGQRIALRRTPDPDASLVDSETGTARLQAGRNTIAVRSCETVADWKFYFRLVNADGTPAEGLQWEYGPR